MRMAKASKEDIEGALALAQLTESACHPRAFSMPAFPDTDEEEGKIIDLDEIDDLRAFYLEVKKHSDGLQRVVFGYQVLLDAVCDPEADHLAYKPGLGRQLLKDLCSKIADYFSRIDKARDLTEEELEIWNAVKAEPKEAPCTH